MVTLQKIFLFVVLFFCTLTLSACSHQFDEVKTQFSEKITGIVEKRESEQTESRLDRLTDDELLDELESDLGDDLDTDFSNLEKELQQ